MAFGKHDAAGVIGTYTEDCVLVDITEESPMGYDVLAPMLDQLYAAFPDMRVENEVLISEGHTVGAQFELVGTHKGEFMGQPASNNVIRWVTCSFFEMTDSNDLIKKETYYYDRGSVIKQLGG